MKTGLRAATEADFPFIHTIAGNPDNQRFISDDSDAVLQTYLTSPDEALLIWEVDDRPMGFALFCELQNPSGRTELRRLGLAETSKGLGQAFLSDLKAYVFVTLDRPRIWLDVVPDNPRGIRTYEKAGFLREGRIRQTWKRPDGKVVDLIVFGMLRDEWHP